MTVDTKTQNLYQKLAKISGGLGAIKKDGRAPEAMGGFQFISHGALMGHLRQELAKEGVLIVDSIHLLDDQVVTLKSKNGEREVRRVVVAMTADFINADLPTETFKVEWVGEGMDATDKAVQKAATSAEKYLLFKVFKVSDQEDPDAEDATDAPAASQSAPRQAAAPLGLCPWCSEPVKRNEGSKEGKPYSFLGCSGFPTCKWTERSGAPVPVVDSFAADLNAPHDKLKAEEAAEQMPWLGATQ